MRKKLAVLSLAAVAVVAFTGCSAPDPGEVGAEMCADRLQYEIEQVHDLVAGTWIGSELSPGVESITPQGGVAYDVHGSATVTLENGNVLPFEWDCSTQTVDGQTYADIQYIDGECSKTRREAGGDDC